MKVKSTFNLAEVKLFILFVGFNELNNIKGMTKINTKAKDYRPPMVMFDFLLTFSPMGLSSFPSESA